MAFPSIATTGTYNGGLADSHSVTIPSGDSGDVIVVCFRFFGNSVSSTPPSGWDAPVAEGGNSNIFVVSKRSDGTETSATFTLGGSRRAAATVYRVQGVSADESYIAGTASLDLTLGALAAPWGSADNLWITAAGTKRTDNTLTAPDDYGGQINVETTPSSTSSSHGRIASAYREHATDEAIEDAWGSTGTTDSTRTARVVIRPGGGGPSPDPESQTQGWLPSQFRRMAIAGASVSAGVTASPSAGALLVSGNAPGIEQPIAVAPVAGALDAAGYAPGIEQPLTVAPAAGNVTVTGHAPSVSQPITVAPIAGTADITGYAPTIEQTIALAPVAGELGVTGYTPAIEQPITLAPTSGDVVATGHAPTVEQGAAQTIHPVSGDVVVSGHTPTIEQDAGTYVHPQAGHVQVRGNAPTVQQPITLSPIAGNATVAGYAPVIEQSLSVQPQSGQIVISGYVPGVEQGNAVTVSPQSGQIAITGYVPGVQVGVVEYSSARILSIAAENRRHTIAAENRRFAITPENRVNS